MIVEVLRPVRLVVVIGVEPVDQGIGHRFRVIGFQQIEEAYGPVLEERIDIALRCHQAVQVEAAAVIVNADIDGSVGDGIVLHPQRPGFIQGVVAVVVILQDDPADPDAALGEIVRPGRIPVGLGQAQVDQRREGKLDQKRHQQGDNQEHDQQDHAPFIVSTLILHPVT